MTTVFDPDILHSIAQGAVGLAFEPMCRLIASSLAREWPDHVDPEPRWMFNLAGGTTGAIGILHASLSEYVLLFGSPVGTEGFSGRFLLDIHDFVVAGEMSTFVEGRWGERVVTRPGERALLPKGQVKGFSIQPGTWMLEYGRGLVPTSLPMALGDVLLSGQDVRTVAKTVHSWGRLVVKELLRGKI